MGTAVPEQTLLSLWSFSKLTAGRRGRGSDKGGGWCPGHRPPGSCPKEMVSRTPVEAGEININGECGWGEWRLKISSPTQTLGLVRAQWQRLAAYVRFKKKSFLRHRMQKSERRESTVWFLGCHISGVEIRMNRWGVCYDRRVCLMLLWRPSVKKGRIRNAPAVWSQFKSTAKFPEKRLKRNAFACFISGCFWVMGGCLYGALLVTIKGWWVSLVGMANLEEGESSFGQYIFAKWEGYQLALTTLYLIGSDYLGCWDEKHPEISKIKGPID